VQVARNALVWDLLVQLAAETNAARSRVWETNIISLRNEVEQYHFCKEKISRWRSQHITKTLYNSQFL